MSAFYEILSTMPNNVLNKTILNNKRTIVPAVVDKELLYNKCMTEINQPELGPEKAIYIMLEAAAVNPSL